MNKEQKQSYEVWRKKKKSKAKHEKRIALIRQSLIFEVTEMNRDEKMLVFDSAKKMITEKRVDVVRDKFIKVIASKYIKLMKLDEGEQELWMDIVLIEYSAALEMMEIDVKDIMDCVRRNL